MCDGCGGVADNACGDIIEYSSAVTVVVQCLRWRMKC